MGIRIIDNRLFALGTLAAVVLFCAFCTLMPINAAFFYSFLVAGFFFYVFFSFSYILNRFRARNNSFNPLLLGLGIALVCLFCGLLLEGLTVVGDPRLSVLQFSCWNITRAMVFSCISYIPLSVVAVFIKAPVRRKTISEALCKDVHSVDDQRNYIGTLRCSVYGFALVGLSLVVAFGVSLACGKAIGKVFLFGFCCLLVLAFIVLYRRSVIRFEACVFSLILVIGSFISFALPPITGYSWDDQIHYDRAFGLSYLGNASYDAADKLQFDVPWHMPSIPELGSSRLVEAEDLVLNSVAEKPSDYSIAPGFVSPGDGSSLALISTIGYIPSALGLWVARVLHLAEPLQFIVGRWFNLICYAMLTAFAVRAVPSKKALVAAIGLLPTSLYLAAQYSYDAVVVSGLTLGICLVLRELSRRDEKLTGWSELAIFVAFCFGLSPKAIYFPLLGLLFLIPAGKFEDRASCRRFRFFVVLFTFVMVASFALPLLFTTAAQAGDARGGSDVSAIGQILFILQHPVQYFGVLWRFVVQYVSPITSDQYSMFFAYLGILNSRFSWMACVPILILVATVAFGSQTRSSFVNRYQSIFALVLVTISVVLVATALYVSFTPVGYYTVNGCQPRYLIPLVFPALFFGRVLCAGFPERDDSNHRPGILAISSMSLIGLLCLESLCLL